MKKEEMKELVKEAVLEALMQFTTGGVAVASEDDPIIIEPGDGEQPTRPDDGGEDESGKGGGSEESSGGGTGSDGKPKPDVGVGAFSLR